VGLDWENATPWAHTSGRGLKPAGFVASPRCGGCGCPAELHLSAFERLSVPEPTHQLPQGFQGSAGTHQTLMCQGHSNAGEGRGERAACAGHGAWSPELAHPPAQPGALALPAEALTGAAAPDGPRTGLGSLREGNGTRMLQCPGMPLFHSAAKDSGQPAPEASKSRTCQVVSGMQFSPTIYNF